MKGIYRKKREGGLRQLEREFWPFGKDQPPVLDYTEYWLIYETDDGEWIIIDGNHQKLLLEKIGIKSWPCRFIPKEAVSNYFLLCNVAQQVF